MIWQDDNSKEDVILPDASWELGLLLMKAFFGFAERQQLQPMEATGLANTR